MKRKHEEISRRAFHIWLENNCPNKTIKWIDVALIDEPPDWYLKVNQRLFAIEATSVVDYLWNFDPPLPSFSVSSYLSHLGKRIEKIAKSWGPLNGAYVVTLAPIPNLREHEQGIIDDILSFIEETRDIKSETELILGKVGFNTLSVSKLESNNEFVSVTISFGVKTEVEALSDLEKVLSKIIDKKTSLLQSINCPIILLLLDAYNYSHIADWKKVISKMDIPECYETICRIQSEKDSNILYSCNEWWRD
jgi:hypothetical protein